MAVIASSWDIPAWVAIAAYATAQDLVLASFCASDPPAMPTFSSSDIVDILNFTSVLPSAGMAKLTDLIQIACWWAFCECKTTSTPSLPAAPTYPAGAPALSNPQIPAKSAGECWDVQHSYNGSDFAVSTAVDATYLLPGDVTATMGSGSVAKPIPTPLPAQMTVSVTWQLGTVASSVFEPNVNFWDASKTFISSHIVVGVRGTTVTNTFAVPTNAVYWNAAMVYGGNSGNDVGIVEVSFFCSGTTPNTPVTPCCPPDPTLAAGLQTILNTLNAIYGALPSSPSSLSEGTVHSGLTGSGNFATSASSIACKVTFTVGTAQGQEAGDPTQYFEVGWITTSAAEGNYVPTRLVTSPQLFVFNPLVDAVHYTLEPGVTATITELSRGP